MNVVKKINTLEVILYFDEYIEIKEIWYFEKFLRERFQFQNVDIKIKYHDKVEKKSIKNEWKNIIAYMAHKYTLTKPILLLKSYLEVENQEITIKMHIKGADFLKAKKTDKELIKVLKNYLFFSKVIEDLVFILKKYDDYYIVQFSGKIKLNLYMHLSLMIERVLLNSDKQNMTNLFRDEKAKEFQSVSKTIFKPVEMKYNIVINDFEISLIYELIENYI